MGSAGLGKPWLLALTLAASVLGHLALVWQCRPQRWLQVPGIHGVVIEENQLALTHVTSVQECARECMLLTSCESFFFHPDSSSCHLHAGVFRPSDQVPRLPRPGARYLSAEGVVSCGQPEPVANVSLTYDGVTTGNVVNYTCVSPDATFFGTSGVCTADGEWVGGGVCHITRWYNLNVYIFQGVGEIYVDVPFPVVPLPVGLVVRLKGTVGSSLNPFEVQLMNPPSVSCPFYMISDHRPLVFDEYISGAWQIASHSPPPNFPLAAYVTYDMNITVHQSAYTVRVNDWEYTYSVQLDPTNVTQFGMVKNPDTSLTELSFLYPRPQQ